MLASSSKTSSRVRSVAGDHVDLYGYTSMAVAALKVQSEQLRTLQAELARLRTRLGQLERRCEHERANARPTTQAK